MKRRDSLKYMLVGTIAGATVTSTTSCKTEIDDAKGVVKDNTKNLYGRIPSEIEHDDKVNVETYFNEHEMLTIATLCDIILPATPSAGSATEAKVPDFIEFIVKDLPGNKLPFRGGLMWLDTEANQRFEKRFIDCTPEQEIEIIDDIAYPDPDGEKPEMAPGIKFFNQIRNLTMTGYYTTKMGFEDLGVTSNFANVWDGVPEEVLANHDVDYDPEWLAKCVDQSKRNDIAEWDEEGNLLT
ncbi:gluconate 2-dehydrogenase subunit 3 family protein [Saprospiraceae bacterium]|nr:gluconate 2-dehydrogenase subunit 3 family protein [bacterium]MDC3219792.1 gluconate 2-dehydrogenase subunit 3 family protein [Saprospiraceae bacterium]MDG1434201.1 gluconate 2-dehydrogenase subunit 3 family protein [Saprospiraceae bacterium]